MDIALASGQTSPSEKKLTLHLQQREASADILAKAIEITSEIARNKTTFHESYTLQDVFPRDVACVLRDLMRQLSGPVQTFSSPDFLLANEQSHLSGLRLVAHKMQNGIQNIVIYFSSLRGSLQDFLVPNFHERMGFAPRAADVNASILGDIAIPLLNLVRHTCTCRANENGPLGEFRERLKENADEAVFRIELLKRLQRSTPNQCFEQSPKPASDALPHYGVSKADF